MRILGITMLAAALWLGVAAAADAAPDGDKPDNRYVHWETHREAVDRSRQEGKPLLIHFTARWCKWCQKMKRETYDDIQVKRYLNEHFTMTMIDTEELPAMAEKFGVRGLPTLWFLDAQGRRLTHVPGYMSAENLLPLLKFIATGAYETHDYQDWRDHRK